MKQFLRGVRQSKWFKHPGVDWLEDGELQGDALGDIQTKNCLLSVFRVNSEADRQRVATALAATKDHLTNVDYVVFADSNLDSLGITVHRTKGHTPDEGANDLHYELGNLTVRRLVQLAVILSCGEHKRIPEKKIGLWLQEAIKEGKLNQEMIKPRIIQKISHKV